MYGSFLFPILERKKLMELLYIWIEEYKNIKKQGFNFNPKYKFEVEVNKNKENQIKDCKLTYTKNSNYIKEFFRKRIINLTAIIGENGVGKSSLLEFIIGRDTSNKYVIIYEERELIYYESNIENVMIPEECQISKMDFWNDGQNSWLIYYNPFFSGKDTFLPSKGVLDLSIDSILVNTSNNTDKVSYYSEMIRKQVTFIASNIIKKEVNNFSFLPSDIHLYYNINASWYLKKYGHLGGFIEKVKEAKPKDKDDILFMIKLSFITNLVMRYEEGMEYVEKALFNKKISFNKIIETLSEKNYHHVAGRKASSAELKGLFSDLLALIDELKPTMTDHEIILTNRVKKTEMLIPLISHLAAEPQGLPLFQFRYIKGDREVFLSSGEMALLNLFAHLRANKFRKQDEDLILLIDEGELGFHPQWQKEYLKILIDFLPKIFKDKKIQIILTSHSPFLVSDLPKENIIFLRKGDKEDDGLDGKCIVVKEGDRKYKTLPNTFGQNIHTLFSHSFFMNKGLMGDFAKQKIREVLVFLGMIEVEEQDKKITEKEALFIISQVGEPLLKKKLEKLYESKINPYEYKTIEELEKEEEYYNKKLMEIRNAKENKK